MASYQFSADYVSQHDTIWTTYLASLQGKPNVSLLEIGSFEGRSTIWFLERILTGPGSRITCVDGFWTPYGAVFDSNIKASGLGDRVIKCRGKTSEVLPGLASGSFDVVYIDAGHREDEVRQDALESWRLAKPGAILIFDDYLHSPELPLTERPQRAIDNFLNDYRDQCRLLHRGNQVIVRKLAA